jgi:predicted alpha/beta-fold hydrolase
VSHSYVPPRWLSRAELQTVAAALPLRARLPRGVVDVVVDLELSLGGLPIGHLVTVQTFLPQKAPAVIVVHGVGGSSDDAYVVRAARFLSLQGFHTVRVNLRGSGRGTGRADALYHAGLSDDLDAAVAHVRAHQDVTAVGVLGFSLGGHAALVHAGRGGAHPVDAVCTISAPTDLFDVMNAFQASAAGPRGLSADLRRVLQHLIVQNLKGRATDLMRRLGPRAPFGAKEIASMRDVRMFDELITVPVHGFSSTTHYYETQSAAPHLHKIAVPTLMFHAEDDPVVPVSGVRESLRSASSLVEHHVTRGGGHVGFVGGASGLWGANHAVAHSAEFLRRHLNREPLSGVASPATSSVLSASASASEVP